MTDPNSLLAGATAVDIFGDIHGQAAALTGALIHLGYQHDGDGSWRPPEGRKALFIGDLIDRGPDNRAVVGIVKGMVERGEAVCLMGNHELNAIHFSEEGPDQKGRHLRPRSDKNLMQHIHFLWEYRDKDDRAAFERDMEWFKSLPLWIETDAFQAVHACWHPEHLALLAPYRYDPRQRDLKFWGQTADKNHPLGEAIETILKGAEVSLPDGLSYLDKDGNPRRECRLRWWSKASHFLDAIVVPNSTRADLPSELAAEPAPALVTSGKLFPKKPTFFGHYWMEPRDRMAWLQPNSKGVCLDFSVGKGGDGMLGIYRWSDEAGLSGERLLAVSAEGEVFDAA